MDSPVVIKFSLQKVLEKLESRMENSDNEISKEYIKRVLDYAKKYPELTEGIEDLDKIDQYKNEIRIILENLFPDVLTKNEIKAASVPFQNVIFNPTERFQKILENAEEGYELNMRNLTEQVRYALVCSIILSEYYNYKVDMQKPLFIDIPQKSGIMRHYRLAINADFVNIKPLENAVKITRKVAEKLIRSIDDESLWKKYFPKDSWELSGIVIMNLTDITIEDAISDLKSTLLFSKDLNYSNAQKKFEKIFQSLFDNSQLRLGFTEFDSSSGSLMLMDKSFSHSFILKDEFLQECSETLCGKAYDNLVNKQNYFIITDVEAFGQTQENKKLADNLLKQNVQSCILAPIAKDGELMAVLEVVSEEKHELNSINAKKLDDIIPYLVSTLERKRFEDQNRIKAVIQSECTSIHPSVLWIFEEEAKRYIHNQDSGNFSAFRDITFEDVYPLYGQIDIVGSSEERNLAIQRDIGIQLKMVDNILEKALKAKSLPIYEQIKFRIETLTEDIQDNLSAGSESDVLDLLKNEVNPLLSHLSTTIPSLTNAIDNYKSAINTETGIIYDNRKNYDDTVKLINHKLAAFLDLKQQDAQEIYPHYFERYKTDGVEHNIYIGASMHRGADFNPVYLYNLRLWQLRTMCEMENHFYHEQENGVLQLNAASMILVFSTTLSIKYRMDEKKFDVDGTYNARYEVIKKRIDKAMVKGTTERVTVKGKIAIIYSQERDAREYERYIRYLQQKNYLGEGIEYLELEDVQGVVGLKALRVEVLYTERLPRKNQDDTITYANLMEVLN